jgi:HPt (histidine-containing phosphotransfer) domain-containing protein
VDVEGFRREMREAGAAEAVDAILGTFVNTAPGRLRDLEAAVTSGDSEAVRRAAHAYRSAAATIRARELATLLGEMEDAARSGAVDGTQRMAAARAAHAAALDQLSRTIAAA